MYRNYIAGQWVTAISGEVFPSFNPANGEVIGEVPKSGRADVERAVTAAAEAFPRWRKVPAPKRGEILYRTHPAVKVISFTGSTETGRRVSELAAPGLKKVSLGLGGKNAIIMLDDADLNLALDGIIRSAFGTTGQRCTACSRLIVQKGVRKALVDWLEARTEKLWLGDGLLPTTETFAPASFISMRAPSAPRSSSRSVALAAPATAIVRPGKRRWRCSPSGSRSTWITAGGYQEPRLTQTRWCKSKLVLEQ